MMGLEAIAREPQEDPLNPVATREQLYESLRREIVARERAERKAQGMEDLRRASDESLKNTLAVVNYLEGQVRELIVEIDRKEDDCLEYEGILSCMSREQVAAAEAAWEKKQAAEV